MWSLILLAAACSLWGQTPGAGGGPHTAAQRYEMFRNHLAIRAAAITRDQFQGVHSLEDWTRRRPEVRRQLLDMLGLDPLPARTPLNARITGGFERDSHRVENIVFESKPGLYVTGNLYLPRAAGAPARFPAVVYVSGHSPGPAGAKFDYQHHGIWFARHGFAAFVLDTIEFGEIPGIHHGTHNLGMWHWLSLGYTPAGVEVWNAIRALDYLETRKDVDTAKAGITGRSGGGAITWFTAAADDRFQVAAPVHGTWSVGPHVAGDVVRENCDCIYFWNTYQLDLAVVGALIAPRPLKIVNAKKDGAFPPAGYDAVYQCLRPVYDWYGAPEKLDAFDLETGHQDLPPYRKAANEWLNRWLRGDLTPFEEGDVPREDASRLTVLKSYPSDASNEGIHRTFIAAPKAQPWKTLPDWRRRREQLIAALKEKVFRAFPKRRVPFEAWKGKLNVWTTRYAESHNVEFTTDESVRVHGQLFVPRNGKARHPALIYVKAKDDLVFSVDYDLLLSAFASHVVLVLNPRAVDYPMDNFRTAATKMTAALLGGTLESMQLWDILRSVDYLVDEEKLSLSSISLYGRKHMGALALHAAALDDRISRVILEDPPVSHWQGPALLNVLRLTDLPEVAGLVAPREIVSLTPLPEAFRYTSSIFRLYGKGNPIREALSLGEALRVSEHSR
ncbi:MAG: acetylxylan esterase [Acidobacteria bacterium]|nr:acetylxylan esterase [Acidobacteriota bacterium]